MKRFGMIHHNQERSDEAIDDIVHHCGEILGNQRDKLDCFAVYQGMEIEV